MANRGRPPGARATHTEVVDAIRALAALGFSAAEISRQLGDQAPPARTVRDIARRDADEDRSGAWSAPSRDFNSTQAEVVLDVLRAVVKSSGGRRTFLTNAEADTVARLAAVCADLPPLAMWRLARLYLQRAQATLSTEDLTVYLAFAPWRGAEDAASYAELVKRGQVPAAPYYLVGVPQGDRDYDNQANVRRRLAEVAERINMDRPLQGEGNDGPEG